MTSIKLRRTVAGSALLLLVAIGVTLAALYHHHVVVSPGPEFEKRQVYSIIAQESPVFYRDGQTRIGVFFEDEHRSFVAWEDLPRAYVASIVAAEDARFWGHAGFDVWHIARAMRDNLTAGRLVAGGSTLTQQTAKNLFYRPDRSLRAKLIEGLNALRLERHFDKTEILTFYANQFHVSGNGRGLGIGARHFFDKEVSELTVLECAFLAGLVKAPAYYDPFIGDEARRERAIVRAHERTAYVLRRLGEVDAADLAGPLPGWGASPAEEEAHAARTAAVAAVQQEAARLLADGYELAFRRGTFRFDSSAVLDEVARRLAEPPFDTVLAQAGIDDPDTAGLQVITTLDAETQRAAIYGLWHHLTEAGVMMEERGVEAFIRDDQRGPTSASGEDLRPLDFRVAAVLAEELEGDRRALRVDVGGGRTCLVDRDAIVRAAVAIERGRVGSTSAKVPTKDVDALVDALPPETVVWVSVRSVDEDGARCDLEVRPELQGATVVLEDGQVRAMVGGNDNRNFNRATAPRQLGSTWKPVIYHAAIELGWSPDDVLDNLPSNIFPFSTTFYMPRPDHASTDRVSLAWAGVRSENVASVWLLYHLVDKLDAEGVAELAATLGLARGEGEEREGYMLRIQRAGVLPTPSRVQEALFLQARQEVLRSQLTHAEDAVALQSMHYGWGFDAERRRASDARKRQALDHAWLAIEPLRESCSERYAVLAASLSAGIVPMLEDSPEIVVRREGDRLEVACGVRPEGFVDPTLDLLEAELEQPPMIRLPGFLRPRQRVVLAPEGDMRIGRVHAGTIDAVRSALERKLLEREVAGVSAPDLYDPELLYWHQDFRVLLALRYVRKMVERYGTDTEVREVLSMPLGASEITIEEAATIYGVLTSGQSWSFPGVTISSKGTVATGIPAARTLMIAELRDVDGRVLYSARPRAERVVDAEVAEMTADILAQVVQHGTGMRARGAVVLGGKPLPIAGKTGTTNDYRNAAFVGVVPHVEAGELVFDGSWVVATYVGYDDNRQMRRKSLRYDGSKGALPAWVATVGGIARAGRLGVVERAPPEGWTLPEPEGLVRMAVDPESGGIVVDGADGPEILTRSSPETVAIDLSSVLDGVQRPIRIAPRLKRPGDKPRGLGRLWQREEGD